MGNLINRGDVLQVVGPSGAYIPAVQHMINIYRSGGEVSQPNTGNEIFLALGHGFQVGDKILVRPGLDNIYSGIVQVTVVEPSKITLTPGTNIATNTTDLIANLGADTGTQTPRYDGNPLSDLPYYFDQGGSNSLNPNPVMSNFQGFYEYWMNSDDAFDYWELIRNPQGLAVGVRRYVQRWSEIIAGEPEANIGPVGNVVARIQVFDKNLNSLGYLAVYDWQP